ncbi:hypothetical protein WJX74_002146 [Apatococcus lobatus]|uniref:Uncharacterized protein n=1 Tax=Apatococcus lobatus TaxID=904363 RepID=A0AAW1QZT2_9CHLO
MEAAQLEKPTNLELPEKVSSRDVQLQLDSPYEGPLPMADHRTIMKKASLCPESPFAAYSMYAGDQQPIAEEASAEELAAQVAREMQRRRVKRQNKQRQAVRLPRFSPRRRTDHGRRVSRQPSPRLHQAERRERRHGHGNPQHLPPRYRQDDHDSGRHEKMTTGLGQAALLRTISLMEQLQMDTSDEGRRTSGSAHSGRPPRASRQIRHDRNQRQMYSSGEIERQYFQQPFSRHSK